VNAALQDCSIAELQEGKGKGRDIRLPLRQSAFILAFRQSAFILPFLQSAFILPFLQSCNSAILQSRSN
jgi:hypothetical protein